MVEQLRSHRAQAHAAGDLQAVMYADTWLAEALWETGEKEEAEAVLREAIAIGEQAIFPGIKIRCGPSMHHSGRGEMRAAEELLHRARDAASELGASLLHDGWLSLARVHLAVARGDWAQAWASFEGTARSWARIGYRWYRASALQERAEAHLARQQRPRPVACGFSNSPRQAMGAIPLAENCPHTWRREAVLVVGRDARRAPTDLSATGPSASLEALAPASDTSLQDRLERAATIARALDLPLQEGIQGLAQKRVEHLLTSGLPAQKRPNKLSTIVLND